MTAHRCISCNMTGATVSCIAVGGGLILATNDDGVTWGQPQRQTPGTKLFGVSCRDANTCYAAGISGGRPLVLKTTNRGESWPQTGTYLGRGPTWSSKLRMAHSWGFLGFPGRRFFIESTGDQARLSSCMEPCAPPVRLSPLSMPGLTQSRKLHGCTAVSLFARRFRLPL
jgi:hypothetical protein